jgi:hypothetical protein
VGRVRSQTLIEWLEPIALPLLVSEDYRFEIFEEHQFGYNPEELAVATGHFSIDENDHFATWEVTTDRGNKLGFLSAKIRRKLRYSPQLPPDLP